MQTQAPTIYHTCVVLIIPPEIHYEIIATTIYDDDEITIRRYLRYMTVNKAWREHVRRFMRHDEPEKVKLLIMAWKENMNSISRMMLDEPDIYHDNYDRELLLKYAVKKSAVDVVLLLIDRFNARPGTGEWESLWWYIARYNTVKVVKALLDASEPCRDRNDWMMRLLQIAVKYNALGVLRMLVSGNLFFYQNTNTMSK